MHDAHLLHDFLRASIVAGLLLSSSFVAADDGHDRAKDFYEKIDEAENELEETRKRFQKASARYERMLSAKSNQRKDRYEDFVDQTKECEDKREKLDERLEEMDKQAKKFFDAWRKSSKKIGDNGLRSRSHERLEASRVRYERLSDSYRGVMEHYTPLTKAMRDQIVYLSHELNAESTASLSEDAAKIQARVEGFLHLVDESRHLASDYMASVKP